MDFLIILLGFIFIVSGGFLGMYRLSFVTVAIISGFLSFASYKAFHNTLGYAIMMLGVQETNAFFVSMFIVILLPLLSGMFIGVKVIHALGLSEFFSTNDYYSTESNVADRIFGAGFSLLIYLVLLSLFVEWK